MARMKDYLYDITEGSKENIEELNKLFNEADELLEETKEELDKLEELVELPTGELVQVDKIELKELEKLPFGAIY